MPKQPPNLLLIQADQLKPQVLRAYGGTADTPHLDKLASGGVVFENAYCNFPLCAPSRFSMLSGMLPSRIGAYDNGAEFLAQIPTIAHYLRLAGYHCCLSGKQHFVGPDMLHGFHERTVPELYPTDFCWTPQWDEIWGAETRGAETRMASNNDSSGVTKAGVCRRSVQIEHDEAVLYRAVTQLHHYARNPEQPFFLTASFTHPHEPYYCLQQFWDRYRHDDIPMPATPLAPAAEREVHTTRLLEHHGLLDGQITAAGTRVARHAYLANVSYVDHMIGELLATLELTGLASNTVLVITADHGDMLGEHGLWFKKHFFDHCLRVPLIIHSARYFAARRRADNVSLVDLLPTLCELAGIDAPARAPAALDGTSLVPLCEGSTPLRAQPVYAEMTSESVPAPMFMVKHEHYKLLTGGGAPPVLYDLAADPHERCNLVPQVGAGAHLDRLRILAREQWNVEQLTADIRLSQRRRRLVAAAWDFGAAPQWDYTPSEPVGPALLRRADLYNYLAWQGID